MLWLNTLFILILNVFYIPSVIFLYLPNLHTQLQFYFIDSPYLDETLPFDNRPRQKRAYPTLLTSTTIQTKAYPTHLTLTTIDNRRFTSCIYTPWRRQVFRAVVLWGTVCA